jgi:signal transduction histidine kinase
MRFEHPKTIFRSLRFRLSAWNTAVVLLIVIVTLVGVREALRYTLVRENDLLLLDDAYEVVLSVERFHPNLGEIYNEMDRKARGHADRNLFVQLLSADGDVMSSSGNPPLLDALPHVVADRPTLSTIDDYRIAQRLITRDGLPAYTVRVGMSLGMIDTDVATLTRLMLAAGVAILFIAPLSGYFLAGRATRPLGRIISTAARLRPSHMEERLPIRGTQDELDQLSTTINRFLDLLRDYLERNREFVANAAHELRSPLAAVQSSVEVTLNSDRTVEEYQDMLGEIADQCGQLCVLVNQLLLLAENDAARSQIKMRPVSLDHLVEKSVEMFRGVAEERGVQLVSNLDADVMIEGDADRLRQVINNLVDNSLKFTPSGGQVFVALVEDVPGRRAILKVSDTGQGIAEGDLPHVFERFYRGDKSRQHQDQTAGNGLGLSICYSIVSAHNGTIRVDSCEGKGAAFIVTLPMEIDQVVADDGPQMSYSG